MTPAERQLYKDFRRKAKRAEDSEIPALYHDVFGADYSGSVTPARARESILEACEEIITMAKGKTEFNIEAAFEEINAKLDRIMKSLGSNYQDPKKPNVERTALEPVEIPKVVQPDPEGNFGAPNLKARNGTITLEKLREAATAYSTAFTMGELLDAVGKYGARKLSAVPVGDYDALYGDLQGRLDKENGKKATTPAKDEAKPAALAVAAKGSVTLDDIRPKAKAFLDKNGPDALGALLKTFGAKKLSEVAGDKLPALLEALTNA